MHDYMCKHDGVNEQISSFTTAFLVLVYIILSYINVARKEGVCSLDLILTMKE